MAFFFVAFEITAGPKELTGKYTARTLADGTKEYCSDSTNATMYMILSGDDTGKWTIDPKGKHWGKLSKLTLSSLRTKLLQPKQRARAAWGRATASSRAPNEALDHELLELPSYSLHRTVSEASRASTLCDAPSILVS